MKSRKYQYFEENNVCFLDNFEKIFYSQYDRKYQHIFQKISAICKIFGMGEAMKALVRKRSLGRFSSMMTNFVMPIIRLKRMRLFWFQQDGASPHASRITIDFLKKLFPGRLMS